ncbi:MAG: HIT domain-containing protein [Candidatus Methanomethylicia archaeon]|nr:HIT domain-containing protein [Candidatus Methanomethylicia archaeon]
MKVLWAPWRIEYIYAPKNVECFLCIYPKLNRDDELFILKRGLHSYIVLNAYPYNNGHLMITPYRHVIYPNDLSKEEILEVMDFISLSIDILKRAFSPDGFNIGVNIGKAAGAGVEHLHFHVVPRWFGDTNFMPILSEVKVIPQHIKSTFESLKKFIK